jgi:LacI family transcriptional regulator
MSLTIKDVAARAGVSPKTVSRVINGEPYVRPAVREAVMRVVEEVGYRPNAFARSLSSARSYLIGMFIDDPAWSGYATEMQRGAMLRCRQKHYHLIVEPLDSRVTGWAEQMTETIQGLRLDGAIVTPPLCRDGPLLDRLEELGLPYVRVSPGEEEERSGLVGFDEAGAACEMTEYLIGLGHRDIGFIAGIPSHSASGKRQAGFLAAMRAHGLDVREEWIRPGDFTFRSGLEEGERLLRSKHRPTAIFASNDDCALGVSAAAVKLDIPVPERLSITGCDDAPTARIGWPPITTIRQPVMEMAAAAVDILVDPTYRDATGDARFRQHLSYRLIERESTAPPPA